MKHSERTKFGLLEAIAKEPAIWDKFDDSFRDKDKRNAAWARVTDSCDYDSEAKAKAAWNSTKDEYVKQLKKRPSGASGGWKPPWRFWDAMSVYAGIAKPRPGHSSTFKPRATDILTQPAVDEDDDEDDKENDDDNESIIELSATPSGSSSNGPNKKRKLSIDAAEKRLLDSIELNQEAARSEGNCKRCLRP
ncbi:hypothetical protein AAVH_24290 [Aphelenchoides avenae]|nr:hypothetical protein AAVH_24290 [Aphelenchus avenae]